MPEIRALGGELIVVTQSRPEHLQTRLEVAPKPFPVVCDPDRTVYREFGLLPGKTRMFLSFKVIGSYLSRMFQGWKVRMPMKNEDLMQLGGDFVLDHSRHLILAYRSADPTDRPSTEQLLKALHTAK